MSLACGSILLDCRGLAFLDIVAIPLGYLDHIGTGLFNYCLASEARVQLYIGSRLHAIQLFILGFGDPVLAFLHPYVAGGAGTDASARVIEEDFEVLCNIQKRHRLAMPVIGERAERKLDRAVFG